MAVPCPGCGREYDVALFQFGRTIHCACGRRVGLEARVRSTARAGETRFLADSMLGRLARWLRILGFDVAWQAHAPDEALVRRALREGRVLLTRDRRLPVEWRLHDVHLVRAGETLGQLREVVEAFRLAERARPFTRCSRCNVPLAEVPPEAVRARVPERVRERQREFRGCPECGRIYWAGTHAERMRHVLDRVISGPQEQE